MLAIVAYSIFAAFVIRDENDELDSIIEEITVCTQNNDAEKASEAADKLNKK